MSEGDLLTEERAAKLVSGGTGGWADGTTVRLAWTFHFLGSRAGMYKASPVKITVIPSNPAMVTGSTLSIVERFPFSGEIAKQEEFRLIRTGANYEAEFEWDSTVNNPEQEVTVQLDTSTPDTPSILLADPISRRRNFLISFSTKS
jgi:hypothetical protein